MKKFYLLFCLIITIIGCEKEDENLILSSAEIEVDDTAEFSLINLKEKDIVNNKHILKELNLIEVHNKKQQNKGVDDSYSGLIVDVSKAKYIEKGDYNSYTFPIKNSGKIENLLLSLNSNGNYDVFVVKYDFTPEELANFTKEEIAASKPQYKPIKYDFSNLINSSNKELSNLNCYNNWARYCPTHGSDENACTDWDRYSKWIVISTECYGSSGGDGSTTNPPSSGGSGGGGDGSTGGSSDTDCQGLKQNAPCVGGDDEIITTPIDENELIPYTNEELMVNALNIDPYKLIEIDCDQIQKWVDLAKYIPPQEVLDKLERLNNSTLFPNFGLQEIRNAEGPVVNMDYFPVKITKLPLNPNTGLRFTPDAFLKYIRTNINKFTNLPSPGFIPAELNQTGSYENLIWNSNNPLGAVLHIEIVPDEGSVICSEFSNQKWRFTTIVTPWDLTHPVNGNREFGYEHNPDGSYTYYTRGVDRFNEITDYGVANIINNENPFFGADILWQSFQSKLLDFVNSPNNGGNAENILFINDDGEFNNYIVNRPDWNKVMEVLIGNRPISDLGCK